jgi:hypothetical protein
MCLPFFGYPTLDHPEKNAPCSDRYYRLKKRGNIGGVAIAVLSWYVLALIVVRMSLSHGAFKASSHCHSISNGEWQNLRYQEFFVKCLMISQLQFVANFAYFKSEVLYFQIREAWKGVCQENV